MASVRLNERTWVIYLMTRKQHTQLAMINTPLTLGSKGICAKWGKDLKRSLTLNRTKDCAHLHALVLALEKYVHLP